MNFTYYQDEEVIILCTRKNTKKFQQIKLNPKVAVLIHDFPHLSCHIEDEADITVTPPPSSPPATKKASFGKSYSITLNGQCLIYETISEESEKYR
jgi:hypothetical protein